MKQDLSYRSNLDDRVGFLGLNTHGTILFCVLLVVFFPICWLPWTLASCTVGRPRYTPVQMLVKIALFVLMLIIAVIVVYPLLWLVNSSLRPDKEVFLHPFGLPDFGNLQWDNFRHAWVEARFGNYFLSSIIVTVVTVVVTIFIAATTAFALTRYRFRFASPLLLFFLGGLMIPLQLTIVPLFFQMKWMHMLNSLTGLSLAYIGFGLPFSVFVLAGFFKSLPTSLHESARLDGSSEWQVFWHIMLPMSVPGLITVAIFLFLGNWNEFFVAFMFLNGGDVNAARTLPLGVSNIAIVSQYKSDYGLIFAALVMMVIPTLLVYMMLQRHLTKGITAGAIKG